MHNNTGNVDYQRPSSNVFVLGSLLPLALFIIADTNKLLLYCNIGTKCNSLTQQFICISTP